ncbi:hypothetical protein HGRIS_004568 [Hohenbuehelia grisea]|uniref:Uncharacterized protein n=1 Tax=Hohenbuehelia grisea TaxID=104357 RepID=A0ABR3JD18_9AGAR
MQLFRSLVTLTLVSAALGMNIDILRRQGSTTSSVTSASSSESSATSTTATSSSVTSSTAHLIFGRDFQFELRLRFELGCTSSARCHRGAAPPQLQQAQVP